MPVPNPKRRRPSRILLGAAIAAVILTVVGVTAYVREPTKRAKPVASAPVASAVARPAVVLDGTYRFDYDYEKQTINGAPYAIHTTDNTAWWAFRSSCGPLGCVATGTQLDTQNPQGRRARHRSRLSTASSMAIAVRARAAPAHAARRCRGQTEKWSPGLMPSY